MFRKSRECNNTNEWFIKKKKKKGILILISVEEVSECQSKQTEGDCHPKEDRKVLQYVDLEKKNEFETSVSKEIDCGDD